MQPGVQFPPTAPNSLSLLAAFSARVAPHRAAFTLEPPPPGAAERRRAKSDLRQKNAPISDPVIIAAPTPLNVSAGHEVVEKIAERPATPPVPQCMSVHEEVDGSHTSGDEEPGSLERTSTSIADSGVLAKDAASNVEFKPCSASQDSLPPESVEVSTESSTSAPHSSIEIAQVPSNVDEAFSAFVWPCHLHKKFMLGCKACQRFKAFTTPRMDRQSAQRLDQANELSGRANLSLTNEDTFNFNPRFQTQILRSSYYKNLAANGTNLAAVLDEIYQYVHDAYPYTKGTSNMEPSTFFCCLHRLFVIRLTHEDVSRMLARDDCPYIRAAAFLYLRYGCEPKETWQWIQDYFFDTQLFAPTAGAIVHNRSMGMWVEKLFSEEKYDGLMMPRLPQLLKCEIGARIVQLPFLRDLYQKNTVLAFGISPGTSVEILVDGKWIHGQFMRMLDGSPHCLRCMVHIDDGITSIDRRVSLGLVRLQPSTEDTDRIDHTIQDASPVSESESPRRSNTPCTNSDSERSVSPLRRKQSLRSHRACANTVPLQEEVLREEFLRREREKACAPEGYRPPPICKATRLLQAKVQGYNSCKPQDFQRRTEKQSILPEAEELERQCKYAKHESNLAERKQQLLRIIEKYGSSGAARSAKKHEYHETLGAATASTNLIDGPEMLRLG